MTHPITVPPELVKQWFGDYYDCPVSGEISGVEAAIATRAAQWGADQELEACVDFVQYEADWDTAEKLRAARRPKPSSLKQVALLAIDVAVADERLSADVADVVRRALEALPE